MISNIDMWASWSQNNNSKLQKVFADDQGEQEINPDDRNSHLGGRDSSHVVTPNLLVLGSIYKSYNGMPTKNQ